MNRLYCASRFFLDKLDSRRRHYVNWVTYAQIGSSFSSLWLDVWVCRNLIYDSVFHGLVVFDGWALFQSSRLSDVKFPDICNKYPPAILHLSHFFQFWYWVVMMFLDWIQKHICEMSCNFMFHASHLRVSFVSRLIRLNCIPIIEPFDDPESPVHINALILTA